MVDADTVKALVADVDALLQKAMRDRQEAENRIRRLEMERRGLSLTLNRLGVPDQPPAQPSEVTPPPSSQTRPGVRRPPRFRGGPIPQPAHPPQPQPPSPRPVMADSWIPMNRAGAVEAALREIGQPADRNEIAAVLKLHGRNDNLDDISAALSYLKRTEAAERQNDGKWLLLALVGAIAAGVIASGAAGGMQAGR